MAKNKWKTGDCVFEITPSTKKFSAVWFVTRGERQKDGIAESTALARRDARDAAQALGCRVRQRKYALGGARRRR